MRISLRCNVSFILGRQLVRLKRVVTIHLASIYAGEKEMREKHERKLEKNKAQQPKSRFTEAPLASDKKSIQVNKTHSSGVKKFKKKLVRIRKNATIRSADIAA